MSSLRATLRGLAEGLARRAALAELEEDGTAFEDGRVAGLGEAARLIQAAADEATDEAPPVVFCGLYVEVGARSGPCRRARSHDGSCRIEA